MTSALMKTKEAAQFLNLSPGTLAWWRAVGRGPPFVKCGEAVRYSMADLERWIRARRVKPENKSVKRKVEANT